MFFAPLFRFAVLFDYVPDLPSTFCFVHEEASLPDVGESNEADAGSVHLTPGDS